MSHGPTRWFRLVALVPNATPPSIHCRNGHRINVAARMLEGLGTVTCEHWNGPAGRCGATMLILAGLTLPDGTKARLDAEVDYSEIVEMEREQLTLGQMLDRLYNTAPPGRRSAA